MIGFLENKKNNNNVLLEFNFDSNYNEEKNLIETENYLTSFVTGVKNDAVNLTVNQSRVILKNNPLLSFNNNGKNKPFSISFWVYFTSFSATGNWLVSKRSASDFEWQVIFLNSQIYFAKSNKDAEHQNFTTTNQTYNLNTWYHVCITDKGQGNYDSVSIYIDNVLNTVSPAGLTDIVINRTDNDVCVGRANWAITTESLAHKGYIDELKIYNGKELTIPEINNLYNI